jgi:hypothetical protein
MFPRNVIYVATVKTNVNFYTSVRNPNLVAFVSSVYLTFTSFVWIGKFCFIFRKSGNTVKPVSLCRKTLAAEKDLPLRVH